jgi:site-specific DNA-cytosine methylase
MTDDELPKAVAQNQRGELRLSDVAPSLVIGGGKPGDGYSAVLVPFVKAKRASTPDDDETWKEGEVAPTLNAFDNGGDSRATVVTVQEEAAGGDRPPDGVLAFGRQEDRLAGTVYEDEVLGLTTSKTYAVAPPAEEGGQLAVRRLTPTECERRRLMGWPDDWTRYAADGSEVADSSRYRMCGNGVASPVAEWLGRCIVAAEQELNG